MDSSGKMSYDAYEKMAEYYFKDVDKKPFNAYYERPGTLSLLPDVKGRRVLDAGCAAGWYTRWLLDHEAEHVTALDFSPKMIAYAAQRVKMYDNVTFHQADLNAPLSYLETASFDLILSSLTLHYLKEWEPIFREFYRLLKTRGVLVFSVHHPFMDFTLFRREDYFAVERIKDSWTTTLGEVEVEFYRRPLKGVVSPLLENGFTIERLDEPMPTEEFRKSNPEVFARVSKRPQFLFLRAVKMSGER